MREPVLPEKVLYVITKMRDFGYRADIVGGCVRDFLLNRPCSDYDVTTNARPEEVKRIFVGEKIVETGIRHGTVTLILGSESYEITTYRTDGEYSDSRHPNEVAFTERLQDDVARRDFTMNSICYNQFDKFSDYYGGIEDVNRRIIRAVGDPVRRFDEDALRILRAIRFSSTLGFSIEKKTEEAIFLHKEKIRNISRERVFEEYKKLLHGENAHSVLEKYREIIEISIPELAGFALPPKEVFDGMSKEAKSISLFKDAHMYDKAMRGLHADNKTRLNGVSVLENLNAKSDTEYDMLLILSRLDVEITKLLLEVKIALKLCDFSKMQMLEALLKRAPIYKISSLKVNGDDLLALGARGAQVGVILKCILCEVMEKNLENDREKQILRVTEIINKA